jgi:hypothetical protein
MFWGPAVVSDELVPGILEWAAVVAIATVASAGTSMLCALLGPALRWGLVVVGAVGATSGAAVVAASL